MPYPHEHAARQVDPSKFDTFRRKKWGNGISAIYGIDESRAPSIIIQALRFDATVWTPKAARDWLTRHGYKAKLDVASRIDAAEARRLKSKLKRKLQAYSSRP